MVTEITLKTEGPHGLPSGRRTEVDPLYPGLIILTVYDCGHAFHWQSLERSEPCANAAKLVREAIGFPAPPFGQGLQNVRKSSAGGFDWDHPTHSTKQLFRKVSLARIEPVGFRVKSDLRNHQAIVQPRLYDGLMVTQITLAHSDKRLLKTSTLFSLVRVPFSFV
jgi:hypothetical protein